MLRTQVYAGVEKALGVVGSSRPIRKILADNATAGRIRSSRANFIVASYQQVVAAPGVYASICRDRQVHLVCDEAHHLSESGSWAAALAQLPVQSRLLLSATPVRLDRNAIAGVRYVDAEDGGLVIDPLLEVSMRQAWKEGGILKHLNMQMKDYAVELRNAEGEVYEFTASEMAELPDFDQKCVRQQLRWNEDYVAPLVREFAATLQAKIAAAKGQHQGLVFAATTEHANHLYRLFGRWHSSLRCVVVHSADIADGENARRLADFHAKKYDVLIQVKKASEGFDAPTVSVVLKLDAIFSREPVIQQLGRGLRFNHNLPTAQNLLNVFIGRDPRLGSIIEHLEREVPTASVQRRVEGEPLIELAEVHEPIPGEDEDEDERDLPEIVGVVEAGDAYLDHTGRFVEGQQLTMFGVASPAAMPDSAPAPRIEVVDLAAEMQDAVEYCKVWTNKAAKERARRHGTGENHHAALNLAYGRTSGRKGSLSTPSAYRAKGDWMKRRYLELMK